MTSDGVDGTAAEIRTGAESCNRRTRGLRIKRGDERLAPRYIEPEYPHTPAGGARPRDPRRELQVASALRNRTGLTIWSFFCGAAGPAGWLRGKTRPSRRATPSGKGCR
jgi:hypothetical protein